MRASSLLGSLARPVPARRICSAIAARCASIRRGNRLAVSVLRIRGRNVQGDLIGKLPEVIGARHKVRLAVELNQRAELAAWMLVALDQALLGRASGILGPRMPFSRSRASAFAILPPPPSVPSGNP